MILFYIFTFLSVVTGAVVLSLTVLFQIDTLQVAGESRYSAQEIIQTAGIQKGENLFLAHTEEAEAALMQKLPYIGRAKVSRKLPAKILIEVEEDKPVAVVEQGESFALIGQGGKVLAFAEERPAGCPILRGLALSPLKVGNSLSFRDEKNRTLLHELVRAMEETGTTQISIMDISDPYNVRILYDGRVVFELGLPTNMNYKLRYAQSILRQDQDIRERAKGTLDLSNAENNKVPFDPDYT